MRIERRELDNALRQFVNDGHSLVLGRPGVGKTHSLQSLARSLEAEGTPYLFIAVDELGEATEGDIRLALGYGEGTFSNRVQSLFSAAPSGVVIFDGFDAARSTSGRMRLVALIRNTLRSAPSGWSVVVSVRSYDAAKSPALMELFPSEHHRASPPYSVPGVFARHFAVPELSDEEVEQSFVQIPGLAQSYRTGSEGFRRLTHLPFNLWLIERILKSTADPSMLGALESETELLSQYWTTQIAATTDGDARTYILARVCRQMIASRLLSVRKSDVYRNEDHSAWAALFSGEILTEVGPSEGRAAFGHNILFDYAVSVLIVPKDAGALMEFLLEDPSRPLFLRPSLLYHFTTLWYTDRQVFWKTFIILARSGSTAVKLVGILIPPYVLASECKSSSDLQPLIILFNRSPEEGAEQIVRTLQALRFVQAVSIQSWVEFATTLSESPSKTFAGELASLLERALSQDSAGTKEVPVENVAHASRNLFAWAWESRKGTEGGWYDYYASTQVLPLVIKTFASNSERAVGFLVEILTLLGEKDFPIRYFNTLAGGINHIGAVQPQLAAQIYVQLFHHREQSDAPTLMGGIVLQMRSTRRQDFSMCYYVLAKAFPDFLTMAPQQGIGVAFDVANDAAVREHFAPSLREGSTVADVTSRFVLWGKERQYVTDYSVIWGSNQRDEPGEMLDCFLDFFVRSPDPIASTRGLLIAADHGACAITWATLLEAGAQAPARYAQSLFELAISPPILSGIDSAKSLGALLSKGYEYWSSEQRKQFEEVVMALSPVTDADVSNDVESRITARSRDRLLAHIPSGAACHGGSTAARRSNDCERRTPQYQATRGIRGFVRTLYG